MIKKVVKQNLVNGVCRLVPPQGVGVRMFLKIVPQTPPQNVLRKTENGAHTQVELVVGVHKQKEVVLSMIK